MRCYYNNTRGATDDGSPDYSLELLKITATVCQDRAVIFASWNYAVHVHNQDYRKLHKVQ